MPFVLRPARLFILLLLVSVVLNLADWPYLDEIFGAVPTGVIGELFAAKPPDKGSSGSVPTKIQTGYQLLVGLQAVPPNALRLPEPLADKPVAGAPRLVLFSIPRGIDRPPKPGSLA